MKSAELSLSGVVTGASDDDVHQHHRNALSAALIDPNVVDVDAHSASLHAAVGATHASGTRSGALFDEFYDDWAAFDAAVALAIEQHHPIRKRSSLTFEVYNRTVSKGASVHTYELTATATSVHGAVHSYDTFALRH